MRCLKVGTGTFHFLFYSRTQQQTRTGAFYFFFYRMVSSSINE